MNIDYKQSGVDIEVGNEAVRRIKSKVRATFDSHVVTDLGSFGAIYDLSLFKQMNHPVLVQSIDGVGTKLKIASQMGKFRTIGHDIVNHCCNDVVCQGARPVTFLDYLATSKLKAEIIEELVAGMAEACQAVKVNLIGGETAEMPGVYLPGEHDVVGCITGVTDKDDIIDGSKIAASDLVLGLASNGLHTNGYSLARKLFFEVGRYKVDSKIPGLGKTVGETLLEPHTNYTNPIFGLLDKGIEIKGIAHLTGGGFLENIPRILPEGLSVEIKKGAWPVLPVFVVMQKLGKVPEQEMYRTFNMGIGMVLVVSSQNMVVINERMKKFGDYKLYEIGQVKAGKKEVILI